MYFNSNPLETVFGSRDDIESNDALVTYAQVAVADPKAPAEFRALGPAVWAAQVTSVTAALYIVDPLRLREGGLDDVWFSGYNPLYWPVKEKISELGEMWDSPPPSIWDFW